MKIKDKEKINEKRIKGIYFYYNKMLFCLNFFQRGDRKFGCLIKYIV